MTWTALRHVHARGHDRIELAGAESAQRVRDRNSTTANATTAKHMQKHTFLGDLDRAS